MNVPELQDWLTSKAPEALQWLERMVGINSFSTNPAGVNALARTTAECFQELGLVPEYVPSTNPAFGEHLFLTKPGVVGADILLVSHLDTVFPPEEEVRENFAWLPVPAEDRIYGPGSVDIKGGTVLIWLILGALQQFCPEVYHSTRWMVALNASEEVLSGDFALRAGERCPEGAKAVLVFEGGPRVGDNEFHLVTSRKGRAEYRLAARGRAAHAGSSHAEGVNAIVGLAATIQSAAALTDYEAGLTVNVATVTGGTVLNRVPHEAAAELEIRAFDPETLARAQAALEGLAGRPAGHAAQVEVTCLGLTPAWPHDSRVEKLFQTWADAAAPLGYTLKNVARGGLSDANYLCHLGPTLDGLGPAGGNAHCSELSPEEGKWPEYVEPSSFVPKAAMAVLGIGRLCREISHNF